MSQEIFSGGTGLDDRGGLSGGCTGSGDVVVGSSVLLSDASDHVGVTVSGAAFAFRRSQADSKPSLGALSITGVCETTPESRGRSEEPRFRGYKAWSGCFWTSFRPL